MDESGPHRKTRQKSEEQQTKWKVSAKKKTGKEFVKNQKMKNKDNEKFVKLGITGVVVLLIGIAGYFMLAHLTEITGGLNAIVKILMPFIYGAVIAYLLAPLCNRLERLLGRVIKKKGLVTGLSILLALILALVVVVVLLLLVIPNVSKSLIEIVYALPGQMSAASAWLSDLLESQPELQAQWDEFSSQLVANINSWLKSDLLPMAQELLSSLGVKFAAVFTVVKNVFLGVLISIYLLASRRKFAVQARILVAGIFPKKWADKIEAEVHYADRMFNGFLVGRIIDSVIIGVICFIFTFLLRFDSAVLVSVIVGVTNVIPVFGPFIGAIPCALILLLENPLHCLIFLIFIVILQQVDGNIIGPRILGETTGVSSFWVLFSVLFFGGLWGLLGMIIGVPLFAVIYDIVRQLAYYGLRRHKRADLLPEQKLEEEPEKAKEGA